MTLIQVAFLFFAAIAAGGVLLTLLVGFKVNFPAWLGAGHGLGGLAAMAVLLTANLKMGAATPDRAWWALGVFAAGFSGGALLFRVLFKDKATVPLALVHGSVGGLGLFLLYGAAFAS